VVTFINFTICLALRSTLVMSGQWRCLESLSPQLSRSEFCYWIGGPILNFTKCAVIFGYCNGYWRLLWQVKSYLSLRDMHNYNNYCHIVYSSPLIERPIRSIFSALKSDSETCIAKSTGNKDPLSIKGA
jgi:hypothetical protein